MKMGGKWASETFSYLRVHVKSCSGTGCRSSTEFNQFLTDYGAFYIDYYFINSLLNPSKL